MSKVKEFTVYKEVRVNTGNFEGVKIGYGETVVLEEGDDLKAEKSRIVNRIDEELRDDVDAIELKARREKSKAGRFGI